MLDELEASPSTVRYTLPVDLRDDWASELKATSFFDPSVPTAWLAEGLLPYLPAEAEARLLDIVSEFSALGKRIAIECRPKIRSGTLHSARMAETAQQRGINFEELFSREERSEPSEQLDTRGWNTSSTFAELAKGCGRDLDENDEFPHLTSSFSSAGGDSYPCGWGSGFADGYRSALTRGPI